MHNKSLAEWERELRKRLDSADLLGEAGPISEEETRELGRLIGARFSNADWDRVKARVLSDYPHLFAVYLVFQGIHGYKEGDFWAGVRKATSLDLSSAQTSEWGRLFERIVEKLGFARFPLLLGHRYVGPILAHGGIPDSALPVFFDRFIHPWITHSEYVPLTTREFIQERIHLSSTEIELGKPIIRFLKFGGGIAEDFVDRCRDLAVKTVETGKLPLPEDVGLSPRVTEQYRQWCEQVDLDVGQDKFREFRAPILIVEPWGVGPSLYFPPQHTSLDSTYWQTTWQVYTDKGLISEWAAPPHTMESTNIPLRQVAEEYRVELTLIPLNCLKHNDTETFKRVWRYHGMTKDCPLMLFDACTHKQIPSKTVLPASRLWIYRLPGIELRARPPTTLRVMEELPQLPWQWNTLLGQLIDLTDIEEVVVSKTATSLKICEFAVYKADQILLEGGERFTIDDDGPPLYIDRPPNLSIPLHGTSLSKWHVKVYDERSVSSDVDIHLDLETLDRQGHLTHTDESVILRLDKYLGSSPLGTYRVTIRGALGHRADLRFRILPSLDMVGNDTLHLPDEGQPEVQFLLETLAHVEVSLQATVRDCALTLVDDGDARTTYEVTVGESSSNVPLQFSSSTSKENAALVTVSVPIRRLRWMILLNKEETVAPKWRTTPSRLSLEALEQSREPYLLVDLFGGACDNLEVAVLLVDDEDMTLQEERMVFKKAQSPVCFDLRAFLDTIRHSPSPFSLKLRLRRVPDYPGEIRIPLLFVTRGFHVENLEAETLCKKDAVHLFLRWQPTISLRHRFVRLWPVWCPWDKPLMIAIPDEAQSQYDVSFSPGELTPGKYLLEFGVRNPWVAEQSHVMPRANDPTVFSVLIPQDAPRRRLNELASLGKLGQVPLAAVLERACIRRYLDQQEMAHADFQWCIDNLDTVGVELALEVERCVSSDPDLSAEVCRKVSATNRVIEAISDYEAGRLSEDAYREYLKLLRQSSALSSDAYEVLLKVDDKEFRLYAARVLLQLGNSRGVQALLDWVKEKELSDAAALRLLKNNLLLTVTTLKEAFPDRVAIDLWEKLSRRYPRQVPTPIVRVGCWVRCVAGWGEIERIEGPEGQEIEEFMYAESKYLLHVLLRAHDKHNAERVFVNLDKKTVSFVNKLQVCTCSECEHFSTQHYGLITSSHGTSAHTEKTPGLLIREGVTLSQDFELEFLAAQPENPWA